jgi:predicted PolB exonuclease-like 3'-5' exonuclease
LEFLSEYNFDINHIKGKENKGADALNRRVHELHATTISMYQSNLKYKILEAAKSDLQYMELVEKVQQGILQQTNEDYKIGNDEILMYRSIIYVENSQELKIMILRC